MNDKIRGLMDFLDASKSVYHAVAYISAILDAEGYTHLSEGDDWILEDGGKYYITRNMSTVIAFRIPHGEPAGFLLSASHSDRPSFKIKENGELESKYIRLSTERYGGMLMAPWMDRPLSVAGRVMVETPTGVKMKLVDIDKDLMIIPNVAIHMNRKVNEGYAYNPATDTIPLLGDRDVKGMFGKLIAQQAGGRILGHDLFLYLRQKAAVWGIEQEFISAQALDDLQCAWGCLQGFLNAGFRPLPNALSGQIRIDLAGDLALALPIRLALVVVGSGSGLLLRDQIAALERFQQIQMTADVVLDDVDEVERGLFGTFQTLCLLRELLLAAAALCILQHCLALCLRLAQHRLAGFLGLALGLLRAETLIADLFEAAHQHLELVLENGVFFIKRRIVADHRLDQLIHLLHIVAAEHGLLERSFLNFLRCQHPKRPLFFLQINAVVLQLLDQVAHDVHIVGRDEIGGNRDFLHLSVQRVSAAGEEVHQSAGDVLVGRLKIQHDGVLVAELVCDLRDHIEAVGLCKHDLHLRRRGDVDHLAAALAAADERSDRLLLFKIRRAARLRLRRFVKIVKRFLVLRIGTRQFFQFIHKSHGRSSKHFYLGRA